MGFDSHQKPSGEGKDFVQVVTTTGWGGRRVELYLKYDLSGYK